MKSIAIALSLLVASIASSAVEQDVSHSSYSSDSVSAPLINLRGSDSTNDNPHELDAHTNEESRRLAATTRRDGWLKAHNTRREKYQVQYGGSYVPISWSIDLRKEAALMAMEKAGNSCNIKNARSTDYGRNYSARFGYTTIPTTEWVLSQWENKLEKGYPTNSAITQALWSNTKYVGCADSYNSTVKCSVTVCLYAKGGNCNMPKYEDYQEAIVKGPGCGSCPTDFPDCK